MQESNYNMFLLKLMMCVCACDGLELTRIVLLTSLSIFFRNDFDKFHLRY